MPAGRFVIALDGMGGDHAPDSVLGALELAVVKYPHVDFLLFGDEAQLAPRIAAQPVFAGRVTVRHCAMSIPGDMKPSVALRTGKDSSMRKAIDAVASGEAQAIVSGGNTGALMAMALFVLRPMPGIDRPAITSLLPTRKGDVVMLDLGANVECDSDHLVQFAIMGSAFALSLLGQKKPRIGILNVGSEDTKGKDSVREAARILRQEAAHMPWDFIGFVEGNDINSGDVDVVVTDGFTGNITLKTLEGAGRLYSDFLKRVFQNGSWLTKIGYLLAKQAFVRLRERLDPRRYNGGVMLGLNGICVKSHGGMDAIGFANAIGVAHDLVRHDVNETIKAELATLSALMMGEQSGDSPPAAV
jgi:glycerol-3-phosphate acyltransferase PlsX